MYTFFYESFAPSVYGSFAPHIAPKLAAILAASLYVLAVAALCLLLRSLLRLILFFITRQLLRHSHKSWPKALLDNKLPPRLANLAIPVVIALFASDGNDPYSLASRAAGLSCVIVLVLLVNSVVGSINAVYDGLAISKIRPIRGLLQVVQMLALLLCGVAGLSLLLRQNPLLMVGGIGAAAAVISFIFKDPILGFVAGLQLTANNMLRIGDWIEMPKYSLDGDVTEISMTTVKVRNFDQTITSVPNQALVNDAFVNWRGMLEAGGRRIKRSVTIHAGSVRLCDDALLEALLRIDLLRPYLEEKRREIAADNTRRASPHPEETLNARRLTNLGCFRAYMARYLDAHPGIHAEMTCMVRQLAAGAQGIPLEVYAFARTVAWEEYEGIQADIFDHFYSAASLFDLEVYQSPSGRDVKGRYQITDNR